MALPPENWFAIGIKGTRNDFVKLIEFLVWSFFAPIAAVSSRHLLVELNWHYPTHLLLFQLLLAAVARSIFDVCVGGRVQLPSVQFSVRPLICAGLAAASSLLTMQAALHVPNTTVLSMAPLCCLALQMALQSIRHRKQATRRTTLRVFIMLCGVVAIALTEYRLSIIGNLTTIGAIGTAFAYQLLRNPGNAEWHGSSSATFYIISILSVAAVGGYLRESFNEAVHELSWPMASTFAVSLTTAAISLLCGRSIMIPLIAPSLSAHVEPPMNTTGARRFEVAWNLYMVLFIGALTARTSYVNPLQLSAYFFSFIAVTGTRLPELGTPDYDWTTPFAFHEAMKVEDRSITLEMKEIHQGLVDLQASLDVENAEEHRDLIEKLQLRSNVVIERRRRRDHKEMDCYISGLFTLAFACMVGFLAVCFVTNNFMHHPKIFTVPTPQHFDLAYEPPRSVDIVISTYKEPQRDVQHLVRSLKAIPALNASKTYIYTKSPFTDVRFLKLATSADKVDHLPNVGREGHTYLHHIIRNWDDLAAHTIFLPGNLHHETQVLQRIGDYFLPNRTGFLDLGDAVGTTCDCVTCGDRFGWSDPQGIQHIHNDFWLGVPCTNVLLTLKGAFIASAKRIRGVKKSWWEELKADMEDKMSWMHKPEYIKGHHNSLNDPWFGYTLERIWGLLMQCNDMDVAWKCANPLSRNRIGGDVGDCQCFDDND